MFVSIVLMTVLYSDISQAQVNPKFEDCEDDNGLESPEGNPESTNIKRGLAMNPGRAPPSPILGEGGRPPLYGPLGG